MRGASDYGKEVCYASHPDAPLYALTNRAALKARSLRLTEIAARMSGTSVAAYKRIHRFLHKVDPRQVLWRLFSDQVEFVIGDPTEIERPQARQTEYVGTLKDGKTRGFWALILAVTIAQWGDSRNQYHFRAFATLKELLAKGCGISSTGNRWIAGNPQRKQGKIRNGRFRPEIGSVFPPCPNSCLNLSYRALTSPEPSSIIKRRKGISFITFWEETK